MQGIKQQGRLWMRVLLFFWLLMPLPSQGQAPVDVYVFWRNGCPHCENAMQLLARMEAGGVPLRQHHFEIGSDAEARELFLRVVRHFNLERPAVPLVVVGDRVFVGYLNDAATGSDYLEAIQTCVAKGCPDRVRALALQASTVPEQPPTASSRPERLHLPVWGEVDLRSLSLPALTVLLAAADGFNPCAMWVLVFLIGLLAGMRDRMRMWLLGVTFLLASSAVYFAFMAAWLNMLLLLGMIVWLRVVIGLVALAGGGYALWDAWRHPEPVCAVGASSRRQPVLERLTALVKQPSLPLAMAGIAALALAVNLVELVCSAGIPAVYTQVLALTPMPRWQYYAYLALYLLVFMLDDLAVFAGAMFTLQITGLSGKYARFSRFIGGGVLLVLGGLLLFRPEWLTYG